MKTEKTISEGIEKQLAFMQFNQEEFFEFNQVYWIGKLEDAQEEFLAEWGEQKKDLVFPFGDYLEQKYEKVEEFDNDDYMVLTDDEADDLWEESLENYIDECILPEIPREYRNYFDNDAWKRDAKYDGRGHSLSSYDGAEHEENINGTYYYIYRVN